MDTFYSQVKFISDNLKLDFNAFGIAGEVYFQQTTVNPAVFQYKSLINKYVSINKDNLYINRKPIYFSSDFNEITNIISEIPDDYNTIFNSDICIELKRYLLFTLVEYIMSSISKLLNFCFINKEIKHRYYNALKSYLIDLSDLLVNILFENNIGQIQRLNEDILNGIIFMAQDINIVKLREHVEMDNKMLLIIGYLLYSDYLTHYDLILSPLLGAAQIPAFFTALAKFMDNDPSLQPLPFEYIKYSTYEEDGCVSFISIEEQRECLSKNYSRGTKVLLIDDSLGSGTTVLNIKQELTKYFLSVDTASLECYWSKKIIGNADRQWFEINDIDYVSPYYYRHYTLLDAKILSLKNEAASYQCYVPFAVFDDINFHSYIANQYINEKNRAVLDDLFSRAKIINEIFFSN